MNFSFSFFHKVFSFKLFHSFLLLNSEKLDELIITEDEADYFFHGQDYGKTLGKMLNNKVDTAFIMYNSKYSFIIPDYIKKA